MSEGKIISSNVASNVEIKTRAWELEQDGKRFLLYLSYEFHPLPPQYGTNARDVVAITTIFRLEHFDDGDCENGPHLSSVWQPCYSDVGTPYGSPDTIDPLGILEYALDSQSGKWWVEQRETIAELRMVSYS